MGEVINRSIESADRFFLQQADQAIKRDVIRALLELITNCDDSYRRLNGAGLLSRGRIEVEIQRKDHNAVIRIRDYAEGMNGETMDVAVGTYAAATSGLLAGQSVRGFWGRGLKDAILGLGHGTVTSIKDGYFNKSSLVFKDGKANYIRYDPVFADSKVRSYGGFDSGDGTIVEITVSRDVVTVPQIDSIKTQLQLHYELRNMLQRSDRQVVLRWLDPNKSAKVKMESDLRYKPPIGIALLDEEIIVPVFNAVARLQLFRSDEPLTSPGEEGDFAQGGFVVMTGGSAICLSLLKFEGNEFAAHFYGKIDCDTILEHIKRDEPITTATRDGLNWKNHPFARALKVAIEERVEPFVNEEAKKAKAAKRDITDKKLRDRIARILTALNDIADEELGEGGSVKPDGGVGEKTPMVPASGFGFVPHFYHAQVFKHTRLLLRATISDVVEAGSIVAVESKSPEISVLTPQVALEPLEDYPAIGQAFVSIMGSQVGAEATITATFDALVANAKVKIVSKKIADPSPPVDPNRHGMINGVVFDQNANPGQRVYYRKADNFIVISTRAPSVMPYIGINGQGSETAQAQVLIAEMITEAVCKEIARRGVENGTFLALGPEGQDREYNRIQNKYAHRIHVSYVDLQLMRSDLSAEMELTPVA